jgi:hypothetical protein
MLRGVTLSLALLGCGERPLTQPEIYQDKVLFMNFAVRGPKRYDLLFVIDDSPAMAPHRPNLVANLPNFINVLNTIEGGLPDLHIGVVTSDLGTHGAKDVEARTPVAGCAGLGGDGIMRGSPVVDGAFIVDEQRFDGTRKRNYEGTLVSAFTHLVSVDAGTCTFAQPFEAMKKALESNAGFLRDDAYLIVIFITPQDDCTFENSWFLSNDPALGPLDPFRCTSEGVVCSAPNHCGPRTDSTNMPAVDRYATFLKSLKADPNNVMVSGAFGPAQPFTIVNSGTGSRTLEPSCTYLQSSAKPGVRLRGLLDLFPNRSSFSTICQQDLSGALAPFASVGDPFIASPCFDVSLHDKDPVAPGLQPECSVSDVLHLGHSDQIEQLLPPCNTRPTSVPCWHVIDDVFCISGPHISMKIERDDFPPRGTHVLAYCVAQ